MDPYIFPMMDDIKDLEKYIRIRIKCLYNPFYDYPLLHPSNLYPIVVNPMEKFNKNFSIDAKLSNCDCYKVNVIQYNKYYSVNITNPEIQYRKVFKDLQKFTEQKKTKVRIVEFLESYASTSSLDNVFTEDTTFLVFGDRIAFLHSDGIIRNFIHMCEFYIDGYKVNCSGSYMFFEDLLTKQQYMYYGD